MGYIYLSWPNKELFCLCSDNMSTTDQQLLGQLLASRSLITFLVSLFGNSAIIHIVRKDNSMKTTTNYLIVNQACTDILVTTTESLNDITYYFEDKWFEGILGIITCKLLRASPFILSAFSVWILVAIAVDRFFAVTRPFQVSPLSRHFKKTVVFLWVWSAVSGANILALIGLVKEKTSDFCETVEKVYYRWREFFLTSLCPERRCPSRCSHYSIHNYLP